MLKIRLKRNPEVVFEQWLDSSIAAQPKTRGLFRVREEIYTLPVVVHVIYSNPVENISDEQIMSQLAVLNQDYRRTNPDRENTPQQFRNIAVDTGIDFCLASVAEGGGSTIGINRVSMDGAPFSERYINEVIKPATIWDPHRYLNIWVCNIADGILGYAQFPQTSIVSGLPVGQGTAQTDGVVINYNVFGTLGTVTAPFNKGRTATHEVGHWLGLRHIWGDGPCGSDDYCEDTPESDAAHFSCPPGGVSCSGGRAMVSNFMDYSDDRCMNLFTADQKARMRAVLVSSPRRKSLLSSNACSARIAPPKPDFLADVVTGCGPLTVKFTDQIEGEFDEVRWEFPGGRPSSSKNINPEVIYKKPGIYAVALRATNKGGSNIMEKEAFIEVLSDGDTLPVFASFEPDSTFPPRGFRIFNPHDDQAWEANERNGAKGKSKGSLWINNYDNNLTGSADWLISPIMDFSNEKASVLSFDVAYAPFNRRYSDTLGIFIATGCESVFRCIYYKGGDQLRTSQPNQRPFYPLEDEWRTEMIDLSAFDGQPRVQIAIVNFSGYGNDVYIDNIRISGARQPAPISAFTANATRICSGMEVEFQDASKNQPTSWRWSFPGGYPAADTTPNPIVQYPDAGTYEVILTTSNEGGSHTITQSKYIVVTPQDKIELTASKTEICAGEEITLMAKGANTYTWSLGSDHPIPTGSTAIIRPKRDATYTVSSNGPTGCTATASVTVRVRKGNSLEVTPPTTTLCKGQQIGLEVTGADSYSWSPAFGLNTTIGNKVIASPEKTTTYTVTGTYGICKVKQDVLITVDESPDQLQLQTSAAAICPGQHAILTASGAAAYTWAPADGLNAIEGASVTATPSKTTTYRLLGVTENGCISERTVTIEIARQPDIYVEPEKNRVCRGETISLTATGADRYQWLPAESFTMTSGARAQVTPNEREIYTIIGVNDAGCRDTTFLELDVLQNRPITIAASEPVVCRRQSTILTARGALRYSWSPSADLDRRTGDRVVARPEEDRTYTVTGVDEYGCESQAEITIRVATGAFPVARLSAEKTIACAGEEIQFNSLSERASSYYWEFEGGNPSTSTEPNPKVVFQREGYHSVRLYVEGCDGTSDRVEELDYIVVTAPVSLSLNTYNITLCKGQSFELQASGATDYEWSPSYGLDQAYGSSVTASPERPTTYTVSSKDAQGCNATATVEVDVMPVESGITVSPISPNLCKGESVTLRASGAADYRWSPFIGLDQTNSAEVRATPDKTTTYTVEATNLNGCKFTKSITVTVHEQPVLRIDPTSPVICKGEKIKLDTHAEGVFQWYPTESLNAAVGTSVEAFPSKTTTYTVRGTDKNGCKTEAKVTVQVDEGLPLTVQTQDRVICRGESTLLTASGGTQYAWAPAKSLDKQTGAIVTASPRETTTYTVSSGLDGCGTERSVTVEVLPPTILTMTPATARICKGESLTLEVSGGTRYVWDPAPGLNSIAGARVSVKPEKTTTYTARSLDDRSCEASNSITVLVDETEFLTAAVSSSNICPETEVTLTAEGAEEYEWLPEVGVIPAQNARTYAKPKASANYTVVGKSPAGCIDSAIVEVKVNSLEADFTMSNEYIDLAQSAGGVNFEDITPGAKNWEWDFGDGSTSKEKHPKHIYTAPGTYLVTLQVGNGICESFVQKQLVVENTSSLEELAEDGNINITPWTDDGIIELAVQSPRNMNLNLRLLDADGLQLLSMVLRLRAGEYRQQFSLGSFKKGIYHIQLADGAETFTQLVVYR